HCPGSIGDRSARATRFHGSGRAAGGRGRRSGRCSTQRSRACGVRDQGARTVAASRDRRYLARRTSVASEIGLRGMTERTERWLIRCSVFVLLLTLLSLAWVNRATYAPLDTGAPAPDFAYPTLAGDTISLAALRGEVVLLNIWATWCPPCV